MTIIRRIERRFAVNAPKMDQATLPKAIGQAIPRFRWPREAYVAEPTAEITITAASVVPEIQAGRRVPTTNRRGAIAEPPPIPSSPPNSPPTRPIRLKTARVRALGALRRCVVEGRSTVETADVPRRLIRETCTLTAFVLTFESG